MATGWDAYVDNLIGHSSGNCDLAALIGLNGQAWTTPGANRLNISDEERTTIATALSTEKEDVFQTNGIRVGGVKYQFLRKDENAYYGKKKDQGCITLQKTKQAIVIAHTIEGKQVGNVNKAVNIICEYLEGLGM